METAFLVAMDFWNKETKGERRSTRERGGKRERRKEEKRRRDSEKKFQLQMASSLANHEHLMPEH